MIGFLGTCLQLETIITAHALNTWKISIWRISIKKLALISDWSESLTQSESESYITIDCQSISLSWNKAPIWRFNQILITVRRLRVSWFGALSLTRGRVCRLQFLLALVSAVILGSQSLGTRGHMLLSQIRGFSFRCLVRLAGLRWRYSTPPPHGIHFFYSCHGIEVTVSNSFSALLCYHGNAFVNIRCRGNKNLPSRCLAKITSTSAIIWLLGIVYPAIT
jgi:hypothetical protein